MRDCNSLANSRQQRARTPGSSGHLGPPPGFVAHGPAGNRDEHHPPSASNVQILAHRDLSNRDPGRSHVRGRSCLCSQPTSFDEHTRTLKPWVERHKPNHPRDSLRRNHDARSESTRKWSTPSPFTKKRVLPILLWTFRSSNASRSLRGPNAGWMLHIWVVELQSGAVEKPGWERNAG